jgi:hypothetical protein
MYASLLGKYIKTLKIVVHANKLPVSAARYSLNLLKPNAEIFFLIFFDLLLKMNIENEHWK